VGGSGRKWEEVGGSGREIFFFLNGRRRGSEGGSKRKMGEEE
jgi:hypothetical protein